MFGAYLPSLAVELAGLAMGPSAFCNSWGSKVGLALTCSAADAITSLQAVWRELVNHDSFTIFYAFIQNADRLSRLD